MLDASLKNPNRSIEIKKIFEDGSTVITMSHLTRMNPEIPEIAVVHIFKFRDEKIVELWDLGQQMMKDSPNENGLF
jgi:predicted SnoaL-like aldol condensation-catalyzing enzyme